MKTTWMLLVAGSVSAIALAATLADGADRRPMVVKNITGNLHVVQQIPCDTLTVDSPIAQGRIVITPAEGIDVDGGKSFVLIGFAISVEPFTISGSCLGVGGSRRYDLLSVHLGKAVAFTALSRGGGVFDVRIPRDEFFIREAAVVDGNTLEKGVTHPRDDVTGVIDLTHGTVALHAVVARHVRILEENFPGTLTMDLSGTIAFPDADNDGVADRADNCRFTANPDQSPVATPVVTAPTNLTIGSCADHHIGFAKAADVCDGRPVTITSDAHGAFATGPNVVTWMAEDSRHRTASDRQIVTVTDTMRPTVACRRDHGEANGGPFFRVSSTDDCAAPPVIRLGTFVLANGDIVQITPTRNPGVTFLGEHNHVKHFKVGPGENVIAATDGSGNQASAICQ